MLRILVGSITIGMLIFPLLNLLSYTMSEENGRQISEADSLSPKETFPILEEGLLKSYCNNLMSIKLSSHRPQLRFTRSSGLRRFSIDDLDEFTDDHWKRMLGEKFQLKCSAHEFIPRRRNQLKDYPEMTCHDLCRACFQHSLPVCLRRNLDNDFGVTCYCSYDGGAPILNHTFKIFD